MKLNKKIVASHRQVDTFSCIPMAIEFVLKLIDKMPADSTEFQDAWKNRSDGSFRDFDDKLIYAVRFHRQYSVARDDLFPLDALFSTITSELSAGRYVLIALPEGGNFHNYVIYDELPPDEFRAITKGRQQEKIDNVREMVRSIKGTDIMTYTIEESA
jgi:hypothetical protein